MSRPNDALMQHQCTGINGEPRRRGASLPRAPQVGLGRPCNVQGGGGGPATLSISPRFRMWGSNPDCKPRGSWFEICGPSMNLGFGACDV